MLKHYRVYATLVWSWLALGACTTSAEGEQPGGKTSPTLAGTEWEAVAYGDDGQAVVRIPGNTHITVNFGEEGRITGNAGGNHYFAEYQAEDGSIHVGQPGATRRYCTDPAGVMDQEAGYLEALRSAAAYRFDGPRLMLHTASGSLALSLVRNQVPPPTRSDTKIRFDLEGLNARGLKGPPDGLRALHYEYCIPDRPDMIQAVTAIDPTLQIQASSPGRIGCSRDQLLCLGHTHQPNHRRVLEQLASLAEVEEIREAFFE